MYIKNSRKFTIPEQGFVVKFAGVWRERAICFLAFPQEQFFFAGVLYMRIACLGHSTLLNE